MDEKQTQQHSQHFNLSGEAKQKLEQLTARHYPGKKRRQSQLVEDLITQAFAKEYGMSTATQGMQEPDWLAPVTLEAVNLAQQEAHRLKATEVTLEHLLLGLVEQSEKGVLNVLKTLRVDVDTMHSLLEHLLVLEHHAGGEPSRKQKRKQRREELLDELKLGEIRHGIVSQLTNFGAIVELGGVHGLIHNSQLTWDHVDHPSEVLQVGQEVEVLVLNVDREKMKIALSLKQARFDPWATAEQRYRPAQIVTGMVTKIAPFGAFARIEDGMEGLIPLSELPTGVDPKTILQEGVYVQLRILRIDAKRHHLGLSLRLTEEPDRNNTVGATPDMKLGADEVDKILLEDIPTANEESTIPDVGILHEGPALSSEAQVAIHGAVWIAKRMHALLVEPKHLLLSILHNQRIRDSLALLLPFSEMLSRSTAGFSQDTSRHTDTCPLCKRSAQSHWKHCAYCGQSLLKVCPKCGAPRAEIEGVRYCYECGGLLE